MDIKSLECICCNSKNLKKAFNNSFFDLPIKKCMNCYYHFVVYDQDDDVMKQYYHQTYWSVFRNLNNKKIIDQKVDNSYLIKKFPKPIINLIELTGVRKSLAYSQYNYLKQFIMGKKLFEIGSGEGFILELFEKQGFDVFGIEASENNLDIINKKLKKGKCETKFAEDISTINKKFDLIIISHVLEHIINCRKIIFDLKNLLSDTGILFIEVPNCGNEKSLIDSVTTQPHLHHFTKKSLQLLLEDLGFKIISIDIFSAHVRSIPEHAKYLLKWIFKIDHYSHSTENEGNLLRIVATKNQS